MCQSIPNNASIRNKQILSLFRRHSKLSRNQIQCCESQLHITRCISKHIGIKCEFNEKKNTFTMNLHHVQPPPTLHLKPIKAIDVWSFFSDKCQELYGPKAFLWVGGILLYQSLSIFEVYNTVLFTQNDFYLIL